MLRGSQAHKIGDDKEDDDDNNESKSMEIKIFNELRQLVFKEYIKIWAAAKTDDLEESVRDQDIRMNKINLVEDERKKFLEQENLGTYNFLDKINQDMEEFWDAEDLD